jgi:hypothetical protein
MSRDGFIKPVYGTQEYAVYKDSPNEFVRYLFELTKDWPKDDGEWFNTK